MNSDAVNKVKNALCRVTIDGDMFEQPDENGVIRQCVPTYNGVGVFILPHMVLTAWHVINGAKPENISFQNSKGQVSKLMLKKNGGEHRRDKDLDVALLELEFPIGPADYTRVVTPHNYTYETEGYIVSNFNMIAEAHRVDLNPYTAMMSQCSNSNKLGVLFNTNLHTEPGYSGSPIVDPEGKVMSLMISMDSRVIEQGKSQSLIGKIVDQKVAFSGPAPRKFAQFIFDALQ